MAERSIIDQLDDAVAAMAAGRQIDLANLGAELSSLAEVAQGLIGLPRETFKAELQQQLMRRDSMSSPAEPPETKAMPGNFHTVTPYFTVHKPEELIDFVTQAF